MASKASPRALEQGAQVFKGTGMTSSAPSLVTKIRGMWARTP